MQLIPIEECFVCKKPLKPKRTNVCAACCALRAGVKYWRGNKKKENILTTPESQIMR